LSAESATWSNATIASVETRCGEFMGISPFVT
jgi:hypothetical protein